MFAEDGVEMLALVSGEEEIVMRQLRVLAVEAEVEHEAGAGRARGVSRACLQKAASSWSNSR